MRRLLGLACASLLACATAAQARPFDLEDLLQAQDLGAVGLTPQGSALIVERLRAYAKAPAFDTEADLTIGRTDLLRLDLAPQSAPRPLLPILADGGYKAGPLSPDGARLLVYRLRGDAWDAGVVTLATGKVRWLDLTPELAPLGRAAQWRSNHELLMLVRAPGDLPLALRRGRQGPARIAEAWRTMARGQSPAVTVLGSGRFLPSPPATGAVVRVLADSGSVQVLARGDFEDLEIAPDGRRAALVALGEALQPPPDRLIRVAEPTRRRSLTLFDLTRGEIAHPCPGCDLAPLLLSWSPLSDQVLVFARAPGTDWAQGGFWRISAAGSQRLAPTLTPQLAFTSEGLPIAHAAWLGSAPLVLAQSRPGRGDLYRVDANGPLNLTALLPASPVGAFALDAEGLVLAAGGAVWRVDTRGVTTALSPSGAEPLPALAQLGEGFRLQVNPPRPQASLWVRRAGQMEVYDPKGRRVRLAAPAEAQALSTDGRRMIVAHQDDHGVVILALLSQKGPPRPLLTLNKPFSALSAPDILPVRHRGPTGLSMTSWLYLPKDRPLGLKLPLVVTPYPGAVFDRPPPAIGQGAASLQTNPYVLAAHGYAVLVPSLPRDRATGEPGAGLADQILAAADAAIATGSVDPQRLALFGHSFGGYGALMSAAQSARFRTVIAKAPVTDPAALRGALIPHDAAVPQDGYELNFGTGWSELGQGGLGADPADAGDRYRRNSPLRLVRQISAPVLLIAGDQDEVPISQSQAMFAGLYRWGQDAELVTYWGERHLIASPANLRDLYGRVIAWLETTLPPKQARL